MSISKKILTATLALIATVCMAVALFLLPVFTPSAAGEDLLYTLSDEKYFVIEDNVFKGLSKEGELAVGNKRTKLILPATVHSIANADANQSVFGSAVRPYIAEVAFAEGSALSMIGQNAFNGCINMTTLTIPNSAADGMTIHENAFANLTGLTTINYHAQHATLMANAGNPFVINNNNYINPVTVNIVGTEDKPITQIPRELFCRVTREGDEGTIISAKGHKGIKSINFEYVTLADLEADKPEGEAAWGINAFRDCSSLETVTFTNCKIPYINKDAFNGCTSLSTIVGLESNDLGLKTIAENAFYNCSSLFTIKLGNQVAEIKNDAFANCTRLIEVVNLSATLTVDKNTDNGRVGEHAFVIHTTDTSIVDNTAEGYSFITDPATKYNYLLGYSGKGTNITLPESYNSGAYYIFEKAFYNEKALTGVTLPEGAIREIGDSAFAESGIKKITFPSDLITIGAGSFENCVSLSSVTFDVNSSGGSEIQNIESNAFKGCIRLTSIELPKSLKTIGGAAFEGCSQLRNVDFAKDCNLVKIDGHAFDGCADLKAIRIPASVTEIGSSVFVNCSDLTTVYLPASSSYGDESVFGASNENLLLIATGKEQYKELIKDVDGANSSKLKNYKDNLTYQVTVTLNGSGDADYGVYKLFNKDAGYELQKDGSWESGHLMPTQKGYSRSVWYETTNYQNIVTLNKLTEKLKTAEDGLTIYAKYIEQPELKSETDIVYSEGLSLGINDILSRCFNGATRSSDFEYSVSDHYFTQNDYSEKDTAWQWTNDSKITDAGKYVLEVKLNYEFGEWEKSVIAVFYVTPALVDISENNLVAWKPVGETNSTLLPEMGQEGTMLYFYGNPAVPYLKVQENQVKKDEYSVKNSYVVYTGNPIELELVWKNNEVYGDIVAGSYQTFVMRNNAEKLLDSNAQSAEGIYFTRVTVRSSNNYRIIADNREIKDLGLKFDGKDGTYTVTKTWYIAVNDSLHLAASDKTAPYSVPVNSNGSIGIYLKETTLPLRPTVMKVTVNGSEYKTNDSELISFTLERDGEMITKDGAVKLGSPTDKINFEYYINNSMPAGHYVLTFYIADLLDPNNTDNVLILGNHAGRQFNFTITEASLSDDEVDDVKHALIDTSLPFDANAKYQFASTANVGLLGKTDKQVTNRIGIWKTADYDKYYTKFEIYYSVREGAKANYADTDAPDRYNPLSAYEDGTVESIVPRKMGVYTVFYQIKAPNYDTVITDRYELKISYKLTLDDFAVGDFEYSGSSLVQEIKTRLDAKDLDAFNIYTLADDSPTAQLLRTQYHNGERDSYTSTGTHYVYISIKEGKDYISFSEDIPRSMFFTPTVSGKLVTYLKVEINIVASKNSELVPLAVNNWEYGEFSWNTRPVWDLTFNRKYETYWFVLRPNDPAADGEYWLYGDKDKNDKLAEEGKLGFNAAPCGEYTLTGYAPSETDGIEPFDAKIGVTILKATPKFSVHPYIDGWVYGYDKFETSLDVAQLLKNYPLSGNGNEIKDKIVVKYTTEAEFKKDDPTLYSQISALYGVNNQLSVGYYYMVFTLAADADPNFASWQYGVRFRVVKGQNYWNTTPVIHDWIYGDDDIDNDLKYEPKFGNKSDVKLEFRSTDSALATWVSNVSELKEFKNGHLSVGTYEFRATLAGTGNYDDLVFRMTFNVIPRTHNVWKDAPSIKSWVKGEFSNDNLPFANAAVGEVTYTVTDVNGNVYELNADNASKVLKGLEVGTYTLTATVAATDEYEALTTTVEFSVSEDSNATTGLMIATIVFAVIAAGLAVAGITLFILQNKKADAEFRKAVKSELRRK